MSYIYRALNLVSHKSYIGLTTRTIEERWKEHVQYAQKDCGCDYNTVLSKAIRKYPDNSWVINILDTTDDLDHLKELEIHYIAKYHTYIKDPECNGYNSTRGGDMTFELMYIPVTAVEILSGKIVRQFTNIKAANKFYHSRCDFISKDGIAFPKSNKDICIILSSLIDCLNQDNLIEYIDSKCPNLVYQLDIDGNIINRFIDSQDAHNKTKISQGNISCSCNLTRRMAGGYQWCYQKDLKTRIGNQMKELSLGKPIIQYGMDGKKIKEWPNTESAAKSFGINGSHITSCCNGKRQSCQKFQWRFKSDNLDQLKPIFQKRRVVCIETGDIFETRNHAAKRFHVDFSTIESSLNGKKICIPYSFKYEETGN